MKTIRDQIKNLERQVITEEYLMTGLQRYPEYLNAQCFYYVSLNFSNDHNLDFSIPWIVVGKERPDYDTLRTIKDNLQELVTYSKNNENSENLYFKNALVKLVFLGNTLIAIGNLEETEFILANKLAGKKLSKKELNDFIEKLFIDDTVTLFEDFSISLEALNKFITNHYERLVISNETTNTIKDNLLKLISFFNPKSSE